MEAGEGEEETPRGTPERTNSPGRSRACVRGVVNLQQLALLAETLEPLVQNIRQECGNDDRLLDALMRTGMPIEVLRRYLRTLLEANNLHTMETVERIAWADQVVYDTLRECLDREWYRLLFDHDRIDLDLMFSAIRRWRSGTPLQEIESNWQYRQRNDANQIAVGEFFGHKISLIAQFWGALSVCEEVAFPDRRLLDNIQAYIRDGVSSVSQLEWLNRTGGVDRVLAHTLAETTPQDLDNAALRIYIRRQLAVWRENRATIPLEISDEKLGALISISNE